MTSREKILNKLRSAGREPLERPTFDFGTIEGNPIDNFTDKLLAADGRVMTFADRESAIAWFNGTIDRNARTVYSSVKGIDSPEFADPHAANVVDVCCAEGVVGVGETGSVWVTNDSLGIAAAALFCTDLYLLLDSRNIVDGLHTAYRTINFGSTQYGAFYTGPSATADIEAVHISGAQAFTTLTVLLY